MPKVKSVLVTGSNGQLGQSMSTISPLYSAYQFTFIGREELDLTDLDAITDYLHHKHFDVIINCAAYTAVDQAEQESKLANAINHLAVKRLAEISKSQDSVFIHISTDYVFDGSNYTPYIETEHTNPKSVYGVSKFMGERAIQDILPKGMIIRTSWVYSEFGNNFVKTMLKLGRERQQLNVVFDQIGTPTYAKDLAHTIMKIVEANDDNWNLAQQFPVYHYSNEGVCSWFDFAKAIFELKAIQCDVNPIETKDYPTAAKRPHYSLLNKAKIKDEYDLSIPYWKDSLKICLDALQE